MNLCGISALAFVLILSGTAYAQDIEQRYATRWNVEPIVRFSIDQKLEINDTRCRIEVEPYKGRTLQGRAVGVIHGRPTWHIPVGDVAPGSYSVTHDLRTPLGAEWISGTIRVPQIARHTGNVEVPDTLTTWPQDVHSRIAQDSGPVEFAWDRGNLYVRPSESSAQGVTLSIDLLPVVPGRHIHRVTVNGPAAIPWTKLAPAGPHIGQSLRYSVDGESGELDLVFVGSGTGIYFGASAVGGSGGDDQGPPRPILNALVEMSGLDMRSTGIEWGHVERFDPGDGESVYDWSALRRDPDLYQGALVYAHIGLYNPWASRIEDKERYRMLAQRFVEAAVKEYASLGVLHFSLGFNEPEMFFRSDKEAYFVADLNLTVEAVRRAVPEAQVIAGKFSSGDAGLIKSFYRHGFKDNFDVLDIHPYNNDHRTGTSMGEIVLSHDTLEELGMGHKRIYLGEGWGPTRDLHQVSRARHDDPVSPAEADYHRQFYQNGYRNLITPRMDYSPDWVIGAKYFTLNDNVGGTYWKQAARPVMNAKGEVEYYLIGELRFGHPDTLKAFFCNGGLVDFQGNPKGQWFFDFPPSLPEVRVLASDGPKYVLTGEWHELRAAITNADSRPITDVKLGLRSQTGKFDGQIEAEAVGSIERRTLAPGETWEAVVRARVKEGRPGPLRLALEVDYKINGESLMADDVVRTEIRLPLDVAPERSIISLDRGDAPERMRVAVRNNGRDSSALTTGSIAGGRYEASMSPRTLRLASEAEGAFTFTIKPTNPEPGIHLLPILQGSDEAVTIITPLSCPRASAPPKIDGRIDDWPKKTIEAGSVRFGSTVGTAVRPADYPFPLPPPVEESAIGKTNDADLKNKSNAPVFGADAAMMWDDSYLYIAAVVEDKTFVQNYSGMEVWRQDSLQLAFDPMDDGAGDRIASGRDFAARKNEEHYSPDDYEYALALTADGPQISRIVGPPGVSRGVQENALLAVRHENGFTYYEAALPWDLLAPFKPAEGGRFRLDILVNNFEDDDRYTLGWAGAIADGKYPSRFVPVILSK